MIRVSMDKGSHPKKIDPIGSSEGNFSPILFWDYFKKKSRKYVIKSVQGHIISSRNQGIIMTVIML